MRVFFIFLDGVGLGADDASVNPLVSAKMPVMRALLGGQPLTAAASPYEDEHVSLLALDATLGVDGFPQSATGQAVLLTGLNIPGRIGYHYGPKPNPEVAAFLNDGNTLFTQLRQNGRTADLLNAYPPRYFHGIDSGHRLYSAFPLALTSAGFPLHTKDDLYGGRALSADFTGEGWHGFLGLTDAPLLTPADAGKKTARLASAYDLALFEYWATDYAGHKQNMSAACALLETFDTVLGSLIEAWDERSGLILITSDHGNLEDLSTRRHTTAPVPCLLIGSRGVRAKFADGLTDLTGVAPAILRTILE